MNRQLIIDNVVKDIKCGNYKRAYVGETKEAAPTAKFTLDNGFTAQITQGKGMSILLQVYEQDLQGIDFAEAAQYACEDQVRRAELKLKDKQQIRDNFAKQFHQ